MYKINKNITESILLCSVAMRYQSSLETVSIRIQSVVKLSFCLMGYGFFFKPTL